MTRVLHVIDTTGPGGAETVFVELAARSQAEGLDAVALVRGDGWILNALRERGVRSHILDGRGSFKIGYLHSLVRLLKEEAIDVIQSHLLGSNLYCGLAGLVTGRPVVATFHGVVDFSSEERFRRLKVALMNAGVSQYVAVSNSLKETLASFDVRPIEVIYNGIDEKKYSRRRAHLLRKQLGLEPDSFLVGALGNIRPAKAYHVLLQAAREVAEQHSQVHFVIAGDDKNREADSLRRLSSELRIHRNVHFLGFVHDVPSYLAELDVFALSSSSEGFSIATIEAQAAGVPVVVTRSGGPEEIVEHLANGLLVAPNSSKELADAISLLLMDESLRGRLSNEGRRRVRNRFTIQGMVKNYIRLYRRVSSVRQ